MNHRHLKNVTTLELDRTKCTGCGRCTEVCPHGVFRLETGNGRKAAIADRDVCMECGACAKNCPATAVTVRAGVGCAAAIVKSMFTGGEPTCGCGDGTGGSACCG
jgi:NAD-dependent dihydropyrimidine dehydrogenase PreA subunit